MSEKKITEIPANPVFHNIRKTRRRLRVAAYCRVSTDDEDQIKSYNSMVRYYTDLIQSNKDWIFVGVYADKAITGTKIDKRDEFQRIIQDCMDGKIDMIIATISTSTSVNPLRSALSGLVYFTVFILYPL